MKVTVVYPLFHDDQEIFGTGQVRSVQSLDLIHAVLPVSERAAADAGIYYFDYLRQLWPPFLRVRYREDGQIEIRLLGRLLLAFGAPRVVLGDGAVAVRYPIRGGSLVQKGHRHDGELRIEVRRKRLTMVVEGYYAALLGHRGSDLRRWFYERTQAAIHRRVAESFLDELASRLMLGR